jgi:hypothetical protein
MLRPMTMNLLDIPHYYLLASMLGLIGQAVRGILGLIKRLRTDQTMALSLSYFSATLMLGSLSGLLGGLIYDLGADTPSTISDEALWNDRNFLLMAISAGYFGADAIEGILGKHAPGDKAKYRRRSK